MNIINSTYKKLLLIALLCSSLTVLADGPSIFNARAGWSRTDS